MMWAYKVGMDAETTGVASRKGKRNEVEGDAGQGQR